MSDDDKAVPLRERLARIIEPNVWRHTPSIPAEAEVNESMRRESLEKADACMRELFEEIAKGRGLRGSYRA
jgi:hypothetical protein